MMRQKLFALFRSEEEAVAALQGLQAEGDLRGKFEASLRSEPWTPSGDKPVPADERSTWPLIRFSVILGAVIGFGLAALFKWPLGLVHAPAATALVGGAAMGAIICTFIGMALGRIFPDRNLQKLSNRATHGKVVLDVGVDDDQSESLVRKMLEKYKPRQIANSDI